MYFIDIDECKEELDDCDLLCENTDGGFKCACPEGFELHTDQKQCDSKSILPSFALLFYSLAIEQTQSFPLGLLFYVSSVFI